MSIYICPICREALNEGEKTYSCSNGHSFDIARQRYVNLLPVQQKKSLHPGDTREMVEARYNFLSAGFYRPVLEKLCEIAGEFTAPGANILDVGCGEGYYLSGLLERSEAKLCGYGIDISKDAVRFATRRSRDIHWCTATAAHLPFADGSFDLLMSMFALVEEEEFSRVLKGDGCFLQVTAGENHLLELKEIIYPRIIRKEKALLADERYFALIKQATVRFPVKLETNADIMALFSMTPHFWRISKEGADAIGRRSSLRTNAEVVFSLYRKSPLSPGA